jgi:hypothetical protein
MTVDKGRTYFIGHRDFGVLMVRDDSKRLKVNKISKDVIDAYAKTKGVLPDEVFADLAEVLSYVATVVDGRRKVNLGEQGEIDSAKAIGAAAGSNVLGRVQVSNADFCFVTEAPEGDFGMGRYSTQTDLIQNVMTAFESLASNPLPALVSNDFDPGSA